MLAMYPPHIIPDDDSRSCSQCRIQRQKRRRLERFAVRLKKHIEAKDKEMKSLNKWIDILEAKLRIIRKQQANETAAPTEKAIPSEIKMGRIEQQDL
jgi:cob(I)alamin adenosyltransferase